MSVVVAPEVRSPVLDALDVESVAAAAADAVDAWQASAVDALVVDTMDDRFVDALRAADGGDNVPLVLVTTDDSPEAPVDAVLTPDADADTAASAVGNAVSARDYRQAVSDLYDACQGRELGNPDPSLRDLRAVADEAYAELDDIPPSIFHGTLTR